MITVAGLTPSLDLTYLVGSLRLGEIHPGAQLLRFAGGKALNMARAAATVGADSTVVALLGGRTGVMLAQMLRDEGISVVVVDAGTETRTCVSIAAEDTGQLTEIYAAAGEMKGAVWVEFRTSIESVLGSSAGWLSISGRAPKGSPHAVADLVRIGARYGVRVAVDTHSEALPEAVAARPALVKINRYEAAGLLDLAPDTDLLAMAMAMRSLSGGIVVLTDGTAGSLGVGDDVAVHAQAPDVLGRYPVGSGDSFLGGLVASLDAGVGLREAMRTATACGVANAMVPGQGHFERQSVDQIALEVTLRDLLG